MADKAERKYSLVYQNPNYVHAKYEDWTNRKDDIDYLVQNSAIENKIRNSANSIVTRYDWLRQQIMEAGKTKIYAPEKWGEVLDDWMSGIAEQISNQTFTYYKDMGPINIGQLAVLTQQKIKNVLDTGLKIKTEDGIFPKSLLSLLNLITKFESQFTKLTSQQKADFSELVKKDAIRGTVIHLNQNDVMEFSALRELIQKIEEENRTIESIKKSLPPKLGDIHEAIMSFALYNASNAVAPNLLKEINTGPYTIKMLQNGAGERAQHDLGSGINKKTQKITPKTDAIIEVFNSDNQLLFRFNFSIKNTSHFIDEATGKFKPENNKSEIIKIENVAQERFWDLILKAFNNPESSETRGILANTLLYRNEKDVNKGYAVICNNVLASNIEKFLAGGGKVGAGYDVADCIIINDAVIPIRSILQKIQDSLINNPMGKNNLVTIGISEVDRDWKGDEPNEEDAKNASEETKNKIYNLNAVVQLKGAAIIDLAYSNPK